MQHQTSSPLILRPPLFLLSFFLCRNKIVNGSSSLSSPPVFGVSGNGVRTLECLALWITKECFIFKVGELVGVVDAFPAASGAHVGAMGLEGDHVSWVFRWDGDFDEARKLHHERREREWKPYLWSNTRQHKVDSPTHDVVTPRLVVIPIRLRC